MADGIHIDIHEYSLIGYDKDSIFGGTGDNEGDPKAYTTSLIQYNIESNMMLYSFHNHNYI